jgi:UPF0271 protein
LLPPGWRPLGDGAWRAPLPDGADPPAVLAALRAWPGVRDAVVTDRWAAIYGAPDALPPLDAAAAAPVAGREHTIAVRFDGPDRDEVARASGLSPEELVAAVVGRPYRVLFLGFLPGFAYLGDLDRRVVAPRRPSPRPRVPAGSLGLAGKYAGIYPSASPGGWNLVGSTTFAAWDGERAALAAGDRVRLVVA